MSERGGTLADGHGNGSRAGEPLSVRPSFVELRAESRRLQLEFLRNTIDLALTIAGFGDANPHSEVLRSGSARMAHKSYQIILSMWERISLNQANTAELNPKLEMLRETLQGAVHVDGTSPARPKVVKTPAQPPPKPAIRERLTAREMEVLRHIANGDSTKETAHLLGMSFKTAACHRYRLMDKLAIHDTAGLVRYAIREKLIEP